MMLTHRDFMPDIAIGMRKNNTYIKPNSEPCYQCEHKNQCRETGRTCNIFTRWVNSGVIKNKPRIFNEATA